MKIDINQYQILQQAYDFFNKELFNLELPEVVFTLDYRKSSSAGFFHFEKIITELKGMPNQKCKEKRISIISLNPDNFDRDNIKILATLAHEMCHVAEAYLFKPPTSSYHTKKWSEKMESIGLTPTHDGTPTGKKTGHRMTHIIQPGGLFEQIAKTFIKANKNIFLFIGVKEIKTPKAACRNKTKYTCSCGEKIYSQPGLNATCNKCNTTFKSYE